MSTTNTNMSNLNQGLDKTKEASQKAYANTKQFFNSGSVLSQCVIVFLIFLAIIIVSQVLKGIVVRIRNNRLGKPYLVKGTKEAKKRKIIPQDPSVANSITLKRSRNESEGIEFTYTAWLWINDYSYKYGEWKHVFHKGNEDSWPNRAPGVWLHPTKNSMRVYMNSYNQIANYVDIDNIPLNKWMHVTIICNSNKLDILINGFLKKQLILDGIPKQNYGDVYINAFGGYDGFLSEMRYYDYSISMAQLEDIIRSGPSTAPCVDTGARPPYLSPNWWLTYKY